MNRREFCKLFFPGFGPVVDSLEKKSLNPLNWSRETQAGLGLQLTVLGLTACDGGKPEPIRPPENKLPLSLELPELVNYYPEISEFLVTDQGTFVTERTKTQWVNLTPYSVNIEALQRLYHYFEQLGASNLSVEYPLNGRNIPFISSQKPRTERVLFIIPQEAPKPDWGPGTSFEATTTGRFQNKYVTFVRIPEKKSLPPSLLFKTVAAVAQVRFRTEACQGSLNILSITADYAQLGQEIICNSLGFATAALDLGINPNLYNSIAPNTTTGPTATERYHLYVVENYQAMPTVEMIITDH